MVTLGCIQFTVKQLFISFFIWMKLTIFSNFKRKLNLSVIFALKGSNRSLKNLITIHIPNW
jgi:hypothetical protein